MSQFDTLLDFGDTGTTDTTKQSAEDPFDPFAAPKSNANGGGSENLLDLGFDMQVSSQNGSGKISAEANTNPLYELSNSSGDIMASEPTNPLYEISNDTQNQDLKSASVNPLYDFVENEKAVENQTNGHSEDLLGTTDTNEVDLLGDLGPITSDDSGVTMDTNNLDGTHGEVTEEQRSVESSEDSDTQGKPNVDAVHLAEREEAVNGTGESILKDQMDKGPLDKEVTSTDDQGAVEQEIEVEQAESNETPLRTEQEPVVADETVDAEPQTLADKTEEEENEKEEMVESREIQIPVPEVKNEFVEETETAQQDPARVEQEDQIEKPDSEQALIEPKEDEPIGEHEGEIAVEPLHDEQQECLVIEKGIEPAIERQEEAEIETNEQPLQEEQTELGSAETQVIKETDQETDKIDVPPHEKESQSQSEEQEGSAVHDDVEVVSEQTNEEQVQVIDQIDSHVSSQTEDEINQSVEQAINVEDVTEQQIAVTDTHVDSLVDKQEIEESELMPDKTESEPIPVQAESEPVPLRQEPLELDEESTQSKQTQKQTDSSHEPQTEGAIKVNGTSEENDIGANEEETVRDPNIYRETREKEEVHFTELSNVRQRFESGASADEEPSQKSFSVKDDYDEGGEYESTPTVNPDVVKETDSTGEELPEVGMAKNLLAKFKQLEVEGEAPRPSEKRLTPPRQTKVEYESTPKERLEQYEGKSDTGIFESQPSKIEGIVRYGEQLEEEPTLEKGHAKSIVSKYKEIEEESGKVRTRERKELTPDRSGKVEYVSEPRGQSIEQYEVRTESGVFESTPKVEEDVIRADEKPDEIMPEEGMAKNLLSKFKQLESEVANRPPPSPLRSTPERTKREFVSGPTRGYLEKYEGRSESGTFENEPAQQREVVKSDEVPEEIMPEAGMAKKQMERFKELEKESSSPVHSTRKEFTPPRESSPGKTVAGILENTPTERQEGVVKSTDVYDTELPEQGMAKNIANRFKQLESESSSGSPTRSKKEFTPPPEAGVYENIPAERLVVEQRKAEAGVLESTPTRNPDIAREHDASPEVELPERGYAKNLVSKFRQLESESAKGSSSPSPKKYKEFTPPRDTRGLLSPKSPAGVTDGVQPSELPGQYQQQVKAGVYENEPEVRPDLCREADTNWNEGLPAANTALSMRQRFQEMENKALKELETPEPIHRKEDSQPPDSEVIIHLYSL